VNLYDANGNPLRQRSTPEQAIVPELPHWLRGIAYRADDDIITLTIAIPTNAGEVAVNMEAEPMHCRAIIDALTKCCDRSEKSLSVLDVPPSPASP